MKEEIDYEALKKKGFLKAKTPGDFIFRTRMPNGNYGAKELIALSQIATNYGRGITHATTRQGIEIPFIKHQDITSVEQIAKTAGLLAGTSGPRLRTTTVCPGSNWCKTGLINTFSLSEKIERMGFVCAKDLPHKFKISISGCLNSCVRVESSEIGIHGAIHKTKLKTKGYIIYLGGCGGRKPRYGIKLPEVYTEEETLEIVKKTILFFERHAKPRQRLALLIEEYGKDPFLKEIL